MSNIAIISNAAPVKGGKAENTLLGYLSKFILEKNFNLDYFKIEQEDDLNKKILEKSKKFFFLKNKKFKLITIKIKRKKSIINNRFIRTILLIPSIDRSIGYEFKNIKIKTNKNYDLIICLDHVAYSLSKKFRFKKRLFIMGDPPGERVFVFNKINFQKPFIKNICLLLYSFICFKLEDYYWKWTVDTKNTYIGIFGSFTSARFKKNLNLKTILDLRPPMPIYVDNKNYIPKKITKIVMGGSLGGSFAKSTISNFFNLVKLTTDFDFKFYLIGHDFDTSLKLKYEKSKLNISILPPVKNFESALSKMNIFIIPSNYYIGVRTRICAALSAGNYCIITRAVLMNMPELKYCNSVKIVENNNDDLMNSFIDYHNFSYKKKIQLNKESKKFFKKNYFYPVASKKFLSII
jgi:hypothetical protein